ncbi:MAG: ShlB/FhaC/HecB family hemolysin secretion/activation protein [Rhodocyclaceae bacterium]|nr:ShlB/FhaC/HecB family hemolysin secretion/activation protein [Rhodocyclaceae bacterium]
MKPRLGVIALAAAAAGAGLPAALYAADASEHLNVQQPSAPAYQPRDGGQFELPPVAPAPADAGAAATARGVLKAVEFHGNSVIASTELATVAEMYLGRSVSEADLEALRLALTRHYIERGYVNSGAQLGEFKDGRLQVELIEGRLTGMRLRGLERLDESYVVARLAPDEQAVLNIDSLRERFLLLLENPLFARMNARLVPGERPGEAVLDLDISRARPYQLTLFANNYRPPSTGSQAYGVSGWVRNLTGQGDLLEASAEDALAAESSGRYSLGWRMPLTRRGTLLSLQYEHGRSSVVEEPLAVLHIRSVLDSRDIGISQTFVETLAHKFTLGANRVWRENSTTLLGQPFSFTGGEPDGKLRVRAWRYWAEYSHRTETRALALRYTLSSARNNIQDAPGVPDHAYRIGLAQMQFAQRVSDAGAQVILRATRQDTTSMLPSLDRMALGGIYTVRGYRENQLIRDTGSIVNLELDFPLLQNAAPDWRVNLVPFYDWGRGKNQNETAATLSSAGLRVPAGAA